MDLYLFRLSYKIAEWLDNILTISPIAQIHSQLKDLMIGWIFLQFLKATQQNSLQQLLRQHQFFYVDPPEFIITKTLWSR